MDSRFQSGKLTMATRLIQFSGEEEYKQAVAILSEVSRTRVGLPGYKMVVTNEHLDALNQAGIPYADLTKDASSGTTTPVRP
jgi:hypothetical protein